MGMTEVPFVAEREEFSLFLGFADQLKLSRVLDRKHSSITRKKNTEMKVAFVVTVENLSDEPISLTLYDRIPLSETEEIEVDEVDYPDDGQRDSRGILTFDLTVQGREKKEIRIEYRVTYPPELVERMQRDKMEKKKSMPSPMYDFEEEDVSDQIMRLEKSF